MKTATMISGQAITGEESPSNDGSALDALVAFYRAFNHADLEGLAASWAGGDLPSMDNPIGGIRQGWPSIREGYATLFAGKSTVRVELFDFSAQGGEEFFLFAGRERGTCVTPSGTVDLRIRTTRWFVRVGASWRQIHHHGSIEEPALLAAYQRAILGAPLGPSP